MTEQILNVDPKTGKRRKAPPSADSRQNDNYVRHTDVGETTRDYSRPHTIPPEEFEADTGRDHAQACAEYDQNKAKREQDERDAAAALDAD